MPALFVSDTRNHRLVRLQDPPPSPGPAATPSPGGQLNGGNAEYAAFLPQVVQGSAHW